nr:Chain B, phage-derived peptide [synthetic construct]
TGWETWV